MEQRTIGRTIAAALALAAAAGLAIGWRRHGRSGRGPQPKAREPWSCECGQAYVVAGEGRHRVYWVQGAPEGDPVLGTTCVNCERDLPTSSDRA